MKNDIKYVGRNIQDELDKDQAKLVEYFIKYFATHDDISRYQVSTIEDLSSVIHDTCSFNLRYGGKLKCDNLTLTQLLSPSVASTPLVKLIKKTDMEQPYVYLFGGSCLCFQGGLVILTEYPDLYMLKDFASYVVIRVKDRSYMLTTLHSFIYGLNRQLV